MPCTTLLVGRRASADGSPLVARTEDSGAGSFDPKRVVVVRPEDQPRTYTSVLGGRTIELPENPLRYTSIPNALPDEGIWGCAGINAAHVAMSATETITSNSRVLGADPLVVREGETPGGFGEEDFVTLVLPYIRSAREGVERLGALLAEHGTYEMNGIAFSDAEDIWWLETIGGHHWIARRVPEDHYVTMPNQLGIDSFDLEDAEGQGRDHLASPDLRQFLREHRLDLTLRHGSTAGDTAFNPREAFGSHTEHDHLYNSPRAWYMQRTLSPHAEDWDAGRAGASPDSDALPWSRRPERLLTVEDVKDVLSSHYQGTVYDPYSPRGTEAERRAFRPIGINRHNALAILQVRGDLPETHRDLQWIAYASLPFTALVPMFTNVETAPTYLATTGATASTDSFYWTSRMIAALADAHFHATIPLVERYQQRALALGRAAVRAADEKASEAGSAEEVPALLAAANEEIAERIRTETDALLGQVLFIASEGMTNRFSRSDE